jgi:hypothetical protein
MRCSDCGIYKIKKSMRRGRCLPCYAKWRYQNDPSFRERRKRWSRNWFAANPQYRARDAEATRKRRAERKGNIFWRITYQARKHRLPIELVFDLYRQGCVDCGADRKLIVAALRRFPDSGLRCRTCLNLWLRPKQLAKRDEVVEASRRRAKTPVQVGQWLESRRRDRLVALSTRNVLLDVPAELRTDRTG